MTCFSFGLKRGFGESGSYLPLFALLIFVFVGMLAFVIDHSTESLALEQMQRSVDAAALAGARELDGSKKGWQKARDAAVLAIKNNPIHSVSDLSGLVLNDPNGLTFFNASQTLHNSTTGEAGGVKVTVERGAMWFDKNAKNGLGGHRFRSLEGSDSIVDDKGRWKGLINGYFVANAVRVTLDLEEYPTTFGKVLGSGGFGHLTRSAISVSSTETDIEVAPIAIPYCQLLLDTNNKVISGDHLTEDYEPGKQGLRELIFTEANPKLDLKHSGTLTQSDMKALEKRRNGLTRFESFIRPPYQWQTGSHSLCYPDGVTGWAPSCKDMPLYATIGGPSLLPGQVTAPGSLDTLFQNARLGKLKVRLGDYFAPLQTLKDGTGDAAKATIDIRQYLLQDSEKFSDVFVEGMPPQVTPRWNFPFMRTVRPCGHYDPEKRPALGGICNPLFDLIDVRPSMFDNGEGERIGVRELNMIMDHQEPFPLAPPYNAVDSRLPMSWTNPLCHSPELSQANDFNQRVKRVKVMVVAPERGNPVDGKYCDFGNVFQSKAQKAIPPYSESWPVVIGVVEVALFDFNLKDLDQEFAADLASYRPVTFVERWFRNEPLPSTVTPHYPTADGREIWDRHVGAIYFPSDLIPSLNRAKEKGNEFQQLPSCGNCDSECSSDNGNGNGNGGDDGNGNGNGKGNECATCQAELQQCEADRQATQNYNVNVMESLTKGFPISFFSCLALEDILHLIAKIPALDQCTYNPHEMQVRQCLSNMNIDYKQLAEALTKLDPAVLTGTPGHKPPQIRTRANSHCLPQVKFGEYNLNNPNSYEPLHPLDAGRGCGGIRGRIIGSKDDDNREMWSSGQAHLNVEPALVNDES